MPPCPCHSPPFEHRDFTSESVGTDTTGGRFGEVAVLTCRHCGARWLHYLLEYEGFTGSGRWFRGLMGEGSVTAEGAIGYLESLPWHFAGGSYFRSPGLRRTGKIPTDP